MKTETKQWIFFLLMRILSETTSALVLWELTQFFGTEVTEIEGMIPASMVVTAVAFVPWVYLLDCVFRLFEKKKLHRGLAI